MRRMIRIQARAALLLVGLAAIGLAVGVYLVVQQRIHPPSWVPIVGEREFILHARVTAVDGVLPGQGQAVTVSGVKVGDIADVGLKDGLAVATLRIEPRHGRVHPDATVLLRPKTGLKDMVVQLDPGSPRSGRPLKSGATLSQAQSLPPVDFDEILAALDSDSRAALQLLVGGAGQALSRGGGHDLANTFRRFEPLSRNVATASRLVARRRTELRRLMGNLSKLATELGARDQQLAEFVSGNEGVFRRFAAQDDALREAIRLLPDALSASDTALGKATTLGNTLSTTLAELEPSAKSLGPTLRDLRPFLRTTKPVLEDQLRPFAREAQPTAEILVPAARDLAKATPGLTTLAKVLNAIVDELAYKAPGQQSYLFYVPWASHNTNSVLANQDGAGPVRRSKILFSCGALQLLQSLAEPRRNPTLSTLIQLLTTPDYNSVCVNRPSTLSRTFPAGRSGR